jgi:pentapeptide repeat protein
LSSVVAQSGQRPPGGSGSGSEKINVPLAGPVSFYGFMLLGPAILIALRVYLQIYVEHSDRLDRLAQSMSVVRAPTLVPLQNSLIRLFSGLIFYILLPVAIMRFAWKAAVFPAWGLGLFAVAVAVIASHVMLPFSRLSWPSKVLVSVSSAIIAAGIMRGLGPPHRPFDLFRANLSGQWLLRQDLRKADLRHANLHDAILVGAELGTADLRDANLSGANLSGADLTDANLSGADLIDANLSGANLTGANLGAALTGPNLTGANLTGANLTGAQLGGTNLGGADLTGANLSAANLSAADLRGALNLAPGQLDEACGNSNTKLPEGLTLKPCSTD